MHSGSSISPKHPALPVSIGIAALVLEGRSSALDDTSTACVGNDEPPVTAAAPECHATTGTSGAGVTDDYARTGCVSGSADQELLPAADDGFRGWRTGGRGGTGGVGGGGGGVVVAREDVVVAPATTATSTLQECSLLAINGVQHQQLAFMADTRKRINLKLQQLRSGPGASSSSVAQKDTVAPAHHNHHRHPHSLVSAAAPGPAVIYSGFEKMNVLGSVSPIKNHHHQQQQQQQQQHSIIPNSFINFSSVAASASSAANGSRKSSTTIAPTKQQQQQQQQPQRPSREGPHCEQFLKKIGLSKPDAGGDDGSEHCCSYRNNHCLRWQGYYEKLSPIFRQGEAVCIEVFLGPENDTILLEQWILKLSVSKTQSTGGGGGGGGGGTMTIQSLCAAIRSQLYFSQISAWTELIQNSLEPEIFNHPRIKKIPAEQLVTAGSSGASTSSSLPLLPTARLDVLFRICKSFDSTARFNEKPIVHNFPDAMVADNYVVQVCLKSLPRLDRIPGINAALDATQPRFADGGRMMMPGGRSGRERVELPCHEKGKHRCAYREELDDQEDDEEEEEDDPLLRGSGVACAVGNDAGCSGGGGGGGDRATRCHGVNGESPLLTSAAISHREKQLLKYKKRMLKREKKKKAGQPMDVVPSGGGEGSASGSNTTSSSSSSSTSSITTSTSSNGVPMVSRRCTSFLESGAGCSSTPYAVSPMSYSSCSNGSSVAGTSKNPTPRMNTPTNGVVVVSGTTSSCSNRVCNGGTMFSSSINSIQPPLYSSGANHLGSMANVGDDRLDAIELNSKSTQTSTSMAAAGQRANDPYEWQSIRGHAAGGLLPFFSLDVATQTETQQEQPAATTAHCSDCCGRYPGHASGEPSSCANGKSDAVNVRCSQGPSPMQQEQVQGSSSNGGAISDRHMQYFNNYSSTYDIINDNCDKRQPSDDHHQAGGLVVTAARSSTVSSAPACRPCFIVGGGDGYEGDEDEEEQHRQRFEPASMMGEGRDAGSSNNSAGRTLQKGDLLLQAIQRTATLNGEEEGNNNNNNNNSNSNSSGQRAAGVQQQLSSGAGGKHKNGPRGNSTINNNNYTTQNNNNVAGNGESSVASGGDETTSRCDRTACDTFSSEKLDLGDCRLCKRQKTKHNFKLNLNDLLSSSSSSSSSTFASPATALPAAARAAKSNGGKKTLITTVVDCGSTPPGCRRTLSESLVGHLTIPGATLGSGTYSINSTHGTHPPDVRRDGVDGSAELLLSPGDSPMLSSSTGAMVGGGSVFSFEQMKSYRRAFSEDVIDTISTDNGALAARAHGGLVRNGRGSEEDTTDESGDNQDSDDREDKDGLVHHLASNGSNSSGSGSGNGGGSKRGGEEDCCRCRNNRSTYQSPIFASGEMMKSANGRPNTSTPATDNRGCKEPLYISCSETDCSVSNASSVVSPHKKRILSCNAISSANSGSTSSASSSVIVNSNGSLFRLASATTPSQQMGGASNCKPSPKINLNNVFSLSPVACDDSGFVSSGSPATSTSFPATSPIAIDGRFCAVKGRTRCGLLGGNATCTGTGTSSSNYGDGGIFRYDFDEPHPASSSTTTASGSPVSGTIKSKSAPAFPFSPPCPGALSPRFMRTAMRQQQQQQRSRYPSERSSIGSERSSIGSDEQLSDDELSGSLQLDANNGFRFSPASHHNNHLLAVSPTKFGGSAQRQVIRSSCLPSSQEMLSKVLNRNLFRFGRAPMLGTLEESLLQRRLAPKYQVADFKVLLGASGSFCPTQLTIPVASYFYELPGQHLTTPYVCELRLPRKGYSIPRTGTVQATLLNPLGTVVRMFVVPYDFRDMPAMSTTFIRQRILACDESSLQLLGKNIEQLSNAEQMKLLRYAIHLRFQTSRSGKLSLHTDIRLLISRRTDCDTAAAHAKNLLEAPNELKVVTIVPENPKFSLRIDKQ
ncbi:serine-rich adhesin for platelets [Anopheles aquasalis]|uniref:serine-rich adhesin for platelets n=1 Tax=Anopheles aquasalis TaxID=42839 RepID=UPI00215A5E79|nr:serine-rich adhesin for platelets [Anopheles aquasalis]XP_050089074.1 serine-rich adhesin for platelets [Anopheles aquasalis]XP_050089075.1 serine-rich adhesin for platelets [Anopheles aquasalis]XP_050089076.1 serine-rich adhesin for platelets [Anopheles aquasalis]XP_050089077.1 serine-rich adhesin for platelets [Anopheles aquasalis]